MVNTVDIILKKKAGKELSYDEIAHMIGGYTAGTLPDYQMSAFLMAVCFQGMNKEETFALTRLMKESGDVVDLSDIDGIKTDKHSTGGVGDKTTLIVGPIAAACGVPVAKMSGRGLGFTGGTIDKLESIPGYRTAIEESEFTYLVNKNKISLIGQTGHIAPADKKIYALRDVTGTVENISLITSSIMSKKLASGSDAILLDVKCGSGAFMKTEADAEKLASLMVEIGSLDGKDTRAVITDMNSPLGCAVGNSLEVIEAIEVLKGCGPDDITELSVRLAGMMINMSKMAESVEEGMEKARAAIEEGGALDKLRVLIKAQGGNPEVIDDYGLFPQAKHELKLTAEKEGFIAGIDAMATGMASQHTGAGRETKEDKIDLSAGIYIYKKTRDKVKTGDVICSLYGNDVKKLESALEEMKTAVEISDTKPEKPLLIKKIIDANTYGGN